MENYPFQSPESGKDPEKTGESDASKKKKKTTRVPLPVSKAEAKQEPDATVEDPKEQTRRRLEEMFVAKKPEDESEDAKTEEDKKDTEEPDGFADIQDDGIRELPELDNEGATYEDEVRAQEGMLEEEGHIDLGHEPNESAPDAINQTVGNVTLELPPEDELVEPVTATEESSAVIDETMPLPDPEETPTTAAHEPTPEALEEPEYIIESEREDPDLHTEPYYPPRTGMIDPSRRWEAETSSTATKPKTDTIDRRTAHKREMEAEKRGLSRGVVSGGLVGYFFGRRGRKEAEAAAKQAESQLAKANQELKNEQQLAHDRLTTVKRTQEQLEEYQAQAERQPEQAVSAVETNSAPSEAIHVEGRTLLGYEDLEKKKNTGLQPEKPQPTPELPPEERVLIEETYIPSPGRRVETSTWHRYEVDAKTGKLIDNPELEYGQEFVRETKAEKLKREAAEPQVAVQLGSQILRQTQLPDVSVGSSHKQLPSATQPAESTKPSVDITYIRQQLIKQTTSPLTWIIAFGLVVVLFLIGILR